MQNTKSILIQETSIKIKGLESCGCVTTCGTESILLACKAYREWGKSEKGINQVCLLSQRTNIEMKMKNQSVKVVYKIFIADKVLFAAQHGSSGDGARFI